MEALVARVRALIGTRPGTVAVGIVLLSSFSATAASHRTENFIVTAPNRALAREIAESAERYRAELAIEWLGHELPRWREPCPVLAKVHPRLGAGGQTSFLFETTEHFYARPVQGRKGDGLFQSKPAGRPFGWEMEVQGSRERILDSVLPHEVTHTIFATHFGRPLPRWADEGACTTVEHDSEKRKQHDMLYQFLTSNRGIAFNEMFSMTEYPADILPLYSQGFSLAKFMIAQGGKRKFVEYIGDGLDSNDWTGTTRKHYGFESISDLQLTWIDWVRSGSPPVAQPRRLDAPESQRSREMIASTEGPKTRWRTEAEPVKANVRPWPPNPNAPRPVVPETTSHTGSWYVQQSKAAQSNVQKEGLARVRPVGEPRSIPVTVEPAIDDKRITSRPNRGERQREVLMEWGSPSPILSPSLAGRDAKQFAR